MSARKAARRHGPMGRGVGEMLVAAVAQRGGLEQANGTEGG